MAEPFTGLHNGLLQTLESSFPSEEGWAVATLPRKPKTTSATPADVNDNQKHVLKRALSNDSGSDDGSSYGDGLQTLVKRTSVYLKLEPVTTDPEDGSDITNGHKISVSDEFNESADNMPKEATTFEEFAQKHFHDGHTSVFMKGVIKTSLLPHEDVRDKMASLGIWVNIIKFMGEIPESMFSPPTSPRISTSSIMSRLYRNLPRKVPKDHVDKYSGALETLGLEMVAPSQAGQETFQDISDRILGELPNEISNNPVFYLPLTPSTKLEKIQYVIGTGILRPSLRDEIYCQLLKQLTDNPTPRSKTHGWILLALCISCFPAGKTVTNILKRFIEEGDSDYAEECKTRMERAQQNGPRTQPPSWLEFQAIKCQAPISIQVMFMDSVKLMFEADAAISAHELCDVISTKINLKDNFGFSLYIAMDDKVSSLQNSSDHVLDAISQCEQTVVRRGGQEHSAPWRLFFRKEIFKPWYDVTDDPVESDLIYQQVVKGIKFGEYKCDLDHDLATIVAQHYFVLHGASLEKDKLKAVINSSVNSGKIKPNQSVKDWMKKIELAFKYNHLVHDQQTVLAFKQNVVTFAKEKWTNAFSRFFEGRRVGGADLPTNDIIIAINSTGMYLISEKDGILVEMIFCEIKTCACDKKALVPVNFGTLTVTTVTGTVYNLSSPNATDVIELMTRFMEGLKSRSRFVMAANDVSEDDDSETLGIKRGDLLELDESYSSLVASGDVLMASSERTSLKGKVHKDDIQVLPVVDRPDDAVINRLRQNMD